MTLHPLDKIGTCERIPRSQIKLADYNPRTITAERKRRLKTVLEKHGLCKPLIWNRRSGNLIEGHQRISVLDSLIKEKEWDVPVIVHDVDDAQEREMNIAFNGADAHGEYDTSKLGDLFKGFNLDIEATGFDAGKLHTLIPDIAVTIPAISEQLAANKAHWQQEKNASRTRQDAAYDRIATQAESFTPATEIVPQTGDKRETAVYETDDLFYIVFVYPELFTAARVKSMMGLPEDSRDQDGRVLMAIVQEWAELKAKNN